MLDLGIGAVSALAGLSASEGPMRWGDLFAQTDKILFADGIQ